MRFENASDLFRPGYLAVESGVIDFDDGYRTVAALTRMPGCRAKMVAWWFGWLGGTDQYKVWHPRDHVFSDWENRTPGSHVGASHLVHEYLAGDDGPLFKLRINFRDPREFLDPRQYDAFDGVAICARTGSLEAPVDHGRTIHFVRNTGFGCEMRSRFFLGDLASRDPATPFTPARAAELRAQRVTPDLACRLHRHSSEEMGYLAEFLPVLYRQVTGDTQY
jgi:hypothetical protein